MKEFKCTLCGNEIDYTPGGRGRPPEFHPKCRKLWNILSWTEDLINDIQITAAKKKTLRSRFWSIANQLNNK